MKQITNDWFITFGRGDYDPNLFQNIKNSRYNIKPKGGLWCSPENSDYGWINFCDFRPNGFDNGFKFQLSSDAKIYTINCFYDLVLVPYKIKNPSEYDGISFNQNFIDYEEMTKEYDAIWLTVNGQEETRLPEFYNLYDLDGSSINLYGWDCESLLILNKNCITNVRSLTTEELLDIKNRDI